MRILFENAKLPGKPEQFVEVTGRSVTYIGNTRPAGCYDRIVNAKGKLMIPGLYNTHAHSAMSLFRGYGEDMPLDKWLNTRIFPAEDKLTSEAVRAGSALAFAEMIRNGIVACTDMYYFCGDIAEVAGEIGIKANIGRSIVSFDESADPENDPRFLESKALYEEYDGAFDGRIKIDMSLHAEYTNTERMTRKVADYCRDKGCGLQIHLSETKKEHEEGIARRGRTPARFFYDCGIFDSRVTFAHCVWVSEDDMDLLKNDNIFVAHNPSSNLKLGSGIMPLYAMLKTGINVTIGTDSAASNNTLDVFKETYLASILEKARDLDPSLVKADEMFRLATFNGAMSQGRKDCGGIEVGKRADIVLVDLDTLNNIPSYNDHYTLLYSVSSRDVSFNMIDGRIVYENGSFTTIDEEKVKYDVKRILVRYFD